MRAPALPPSPRLSSSRSSNPARRRFGTALAVLIIGLLAAVPAFAQWSEDAVQNLVVADRPEGQTQPKLAPTTDGGFYVSWFGGGGDGYDVYLQRLDADGVAQWADDGVRVADRAFSSTEDYGLAVDSDGNALLAFRVADGDGRAQAVASRVSPDGALLWGDPGIFVSDDASAAASPRITGTPDGGAVVAWTSFDTGEIVLQRLDADGAPQWGSEGVALATPTGFFFLADLHADSAGNAIVSGSAQLSTFDRRLWTQKLAFADGAPLWGSDPVEVFDGSDGALQFGYFPPFVPDGSGGAVFAWYQVGGIGEGRVRVQHVLADGSSAFPQNGIEAATGTDRQRSAPSAAFDAATGDIFVVWPEEQQVGPTRTFGVAAQRIDEAGARQWGDDGRTLVPLGAVPGGQVSALALGDGAVFAWALDTFPNPMRIEAARLDADGDFVWPGEIVPLKTAATTNTRMRGALSTEGFAAYVWSDDSGDGSDPDAIKAQNISAGGELGPVEETSLTYLYDDGDGDTNQGPPSTFDPDMLWGNYFLTQPGGEVITEISVAFGPTFPSLEDGPVTFWLLDDPDADFDPRNATSLTSVEATPDVFNDTFFTVEIPPTQVSGAFFVGVSALLQGGEDRPARVDTDAPGDRSWFFYAPDIAEVIDDLASAPFGTRMDNPEFVIFPGAFMIRATGQPGEGGAAVASLDPSELEFTLASGETASAALTLANLGGSDLTYAVTVARPDSASADFEDGENPYGLTLGIPQAETIEAAGGNPGRWLHNAALSTFAPRLYVDAPPFTGDYVAQSVRSISIDAQTVAVGNTVEGRPLSLRLVRHNGAPADPEAHDYVYLPGDLVPQPGQGWQSYTFPIPSSFDGSMPEGWSGGHAGNPENLPAGVVWQDVLREVDAVEVMWGHPAFFYIEQTFDLGVDNVQITFDAAGPGGPLTVEPTEGTVAPGASQALTVSVDAGGLIPGQYTFDVRIATNDPALPLLTVPVTVVVESGVTVEDGAGDAVFALEKNYPNPFARETTIAFSVPRREHVTLAVYDVLGRRVATLLDDVVEAGPHRVVWDASERAAGTYLYRIVAGGSAQALRAVVVN